MSDTPVGISVARSPEIPATVGHSWIGIAAVAVALGVILGALYRQVFPVWFEDVWHNDNYSHALIVPFFSGFLAWQRRLELAALPFQGTWVGLAVILWGLVQLFVGDIAAETFSMRTSFIVVLAGLVLFHVGWQAFRILAFPLAYLLFMVPIPSIFFYAIAFPLQNLAAQNAGWALDAFGVPVLLDGNVIHLSRITLGVTEACSGIRSLVSLLALAVAWAHLTLPWLWGGVLLVASAVPITIVANAGRVVATGLIGEWFGIEYAQGFFHSFAGWAIFIVACVCLLAVHGLIRAAQSGWRRLRA